jgi:predicted dehydrogenase
MAKKPVKLLILGTGGMARSHTENFQKIPGVTVVAGVDNNPSRLSEFQSKFGVETGYTSLDDALSAGGFDAVANITPDPVHYPTTMKILAAGKHILCEKPLATNYADAAEMVAEAEKRKVVNMVNLTYRNGASLQAAAKLIAEGYIGEIKHFEASYLQSWLAQPAWGHWDKEDQWLWRLSTAHGSKGVLGDIGIHILDFATFISDLNVASVSGRLKTFHKAKGDKIGKYVLDANDSMAMHMEMENGAIGVLHATRFAAGHLNDLRLRVYGSKGGLNITYNGATGTLEACVGDLTKPVWKKVPTPKVSTNYKRFIAAIRGEPHDGPGFARGAELQKVLDLVEESDKQGGLTLKV